MINDCDEDCGHDNECTCDEDCVHNECTCDEHIIECDACGKKAVVYHNHWCAVICQKCENKIQNTSHDHNIETNECYSDNCYHEPEFICTCDEHIIACEECGNKSVVYHNHWCAVTCRKYKHSNQNTSHDHNIETNECYSDNCYHRPEFTCTCDEQDITCEACGNKSVVYHNHWCAVTCRKCKHSNQNTSHGKQCLTTNECFSEECHHKISSS